MKNYKKPSDAELSKDAFRDELYAFLRYEFKGKGFRSTSLLKDGFKKSCSANFQINKKYQWYLESHNTLRGGSHGWKITDFERLLRHLTAMADTYPGIEMKSVQVGTRKVYNYGRYKTVPVYRYFFKFI